MKPDLRRIEATLGQLQGMTAPQPESGRSIDSLRSSSSSVSPAHSAAQVSAFPSQGRSRTLEVFPLPNPPPPKISAAPRAANGLTEPIQPPLLSGLPASRLPAPSQRSLASPAAETVQPFPVQRQGSTPVLPRSKSPSITHHRHASNPGLAVTLLQEIELRVTVWQQELEQIIQQIRSLYAEGPIVDGWLESHSESHSESQLAGSQSLNTQSLTQSVDIATLRHAETEHLLKYIEELCSVKQPPVEQAEAGVSYRLCGLNADGQLWSRSCPAQQVPYVSLAIARYQKLRILFSKKQSLETRLQQLVETLALLHGQIQEPS
jgi:hypothetical protein